MRRIPLLALFCCSLGSSLRGAPPESQDAPNRYREFAALCDKCFSELNAHYRKLNTTEGRRAFVKAVAIPIEDVQSCVSGPCHDVGAKRDLAFVGRLKALCRYLLVSAELAAAEGNHDAALEAATLVLRIGERINAGGRMEDHLAASACNYLGMPLLLREAPSATIESARRCLQYLPDAAQIDQQLMTKIVDSAMQPNLPPQTAAKQRAMLWDAARTRRMVAQAEIQIARTRLAIHVHQKQHGSLPDSLEALVPDVLPKVPVDPCSDKPLVYRKNGTTFTLYSVGPDGKDDGGRKTERGDLMQGKPGDLNPF